MSEELASMTPTFKRVNKKIQACSDLFDKVQSQGRIEFSDLREMLEVSVLGVSEELRPGVLDLLENGLAGIEQAARDCPALSDRLSHHAALLVIGLVRVGTYPLGDQLQREKRTMKSLVEHNSAKERVAERARDIAVELWKGDENQEIRIGDMAQHVWSAMVGEGMKDELPDQAERLKAWIRPVAPEYAKRGGRSKKPPRS